MSTVKSQIPQRIPLPRGQLLIDGRWVDVGRADASLDGNLVARLPHGDARANDGNFARGFKTWHVSRSLGRRI